jgi:hypothetical protein
MTELASACAGEFSAHSCGRGRGSGLTDAPDAAAECFFPFAHPPDTAIARITAVTTRIRRIRFSSTIPRSARRSPSRSRLAHQWPQRIE